MLFGKNKIVGMLLLFLFVVRLALLVLDKTLHVANLYISMALLSVFFPALIFLSVLFLAVVLVQRIVLCLCHVLNSRIILKIFNLEYPPVLLTLLLPVL